MRLHAIVIDTALLGSDAWTYLEQLCGQPAAPAVVVCTGPSSVAQRVRGLRLGADDWVTKPCHPEEVLARVEAAVRRRRAGELARPAGRARSWPASSRSAPTCSRRSSAAAPSASPGASSSCCTCWRAQRGGCVPRERVYERVWGYAMAHGDRSVDVFVRKLRKKLEVASPGWIYLHTHFGVGYRFDPQEAEDERRRRDRRRAGRRRVDGGGSSLSRSQRPSTSSSTSSTRPARTSCAPPSCSTRLLKRWPDGQASGARS